MQWIHNFQLFLFDFDGLLVNTETIHYLAYKRMLAGRGFILDWDFDQYCTIAHYSADGLQHKIYEKFPVLKAKEPDWSVLYQEKKLAIINLINEGAVLLMPGVAELLHALNEADIPRCVVTHSPRELVNAVCRQHPLLHSIPHWITREHYALPKPHPECYQKAIEKYANPQDRIVGFEDTPRGVRALMSTRAKPVLICQTQYPEIPDYLLNGAAYYPSFDKIPIHQL